MSVLKLSMPWAVLVALIASIAAPPQASAQQAYAYNNIFDDNSQLTLTGMWAVDNTPAVPNSAPGSSGGNNLNYNDGVDYDNGATNSGTARTPTIDLTGVNTASMTFWCRYQTEDAGTTYDQRWIRIYNATTQAQVFTGQFSGSAAAPLTCPSMNTWHQHSWANIPAAALNIPIIVEFYFNTVDSGVNQYQGWFIDDLQIIADDVTPPAQITDLVVDNPTVSTVDVAWSSPFDDDVAGQAQSFDLRYATAVITDANFATATQVTGEPAPSAPGTPHNMTITGLNPGTQYWFAIRSTDPGGNTSVISNVETVTTGALPPVGGSATQGAKPPKDRYSACSAGTESAPFGLFALAGLIGLAAAFRTFIRK